MVTIFAPLVKSMAIAFICLILKFTATLKVVTPFGLEEVAFLAMVPVLEL